MTMPTIFYQLGEATKALWDRTGDRTLGTRVKAGKVQLVSVAYDAQGQSTVTPKSDWVDPENMLAHLNGW